METFFQTTDGHRSNTDVNRYSENSVNICLNLWLLLFLVPFQHDSVHNAADLEQFLFVMHHLRASESGDGVILAQKNRLLRTNFFAHPAENAADHVDIECFGIFLDFGEAIGGRNFPRNNLDRAWRTNEFTYLTCDTPHTARLISHQGGGAAVLLWQAVVPFLLGILHGHLRATQQLVFEMLKRDGEPGNDRRQIQALAPVRSRSRDSNSHDLLIWKPGIRE